MIAVEAPGWLGATREHTDWYVTEEQRRQPGCLGRERERLTRSRAPGAWGDPEIKRSAAKCRFPGSPDRTRQRVRARRDPCPAPADRSRHQHARTFQTPPEQLRPTHALRDRHGPRLHRPRQRGHHLRAHAGARGARAPGGPLPRAGRPPAPGARACRRAPGAQLTHGVASRAAGGARARVPRGRGPGVHPQGPALRRALPVAHAAARAPAREDRRAERPARAARRQREALRAALPRGDAAHHRGQRQGAHQGVRSQRRAGAP